MQKYTCVYYTAPSGTIPVKDFIESLAEDTQDTFFYKTALLEEYGPQLRRPHTDSIEDGIFELRFIGKEGNIRSLFLFFYKNRIIFTMVLLRKHQRLRAMR